MKDLELMLQASPKDATFLNIPISNYIDLEKVCGKGHATGDWAKSGSSQIPLETQQINLDDDNTDFLDVDINTTEGTEYTEVNMKDVYEQMTKRTTSLPSKGCLPRKKRKTSIGEGSIREYIAMVADSVAQVANAIQCSTRASEERKIFSELMSELSSISGFSEEEINIIYDTLSKNTTMIHSFFSKLAEAKARWMRKELNK